jgi:lysophospholipase L1-like esterase
VLDYYKKFSRGRSDEAFKIESARRPDLIVIHLGANDYIVADENDDITDKERQDFVNNGIALVNYLRENYNYGVNVPIIWAYDPGEGFPEEVQQIADHFGGESGDFYTISLPWSEAGAGGHPSANEHAKHAKLLADLIKDKDIL